MTVDINAITPLTLSRELVRTVFEVAQNSSTTLAQLPQLSARWDLGAPPGTGVSLSYAFSASAPGYDPGGVDAATYSAMSPAEQAIAESALGTWSALLGVTFTRVSDPAAADIVFRKVDITNTGVAGFAFFPPLGGEVVQNGDVFLDPEGAGALSVIVHELGHALGLGHPFEGGSRPTPEDLGFSGNQLLSIMDYTAPPRNLLLSVSDGGFGFSYSSMNEPQSPMPVDILAMQMLYGANRSTAAGNTTYSFDVDPVFYRTLWDGGGTDVIDLSNQLNPCLVSLVGGTFSTIALRDPMAGLVPQLAAGLADDAAFFFNGSDMLAIAFDTVIENARGGSAGDRLIGNAVKNVLTGNAGNDTLDGAAGNDSLVGGTGNDSLLGGAGNDTLAGGTGTDTLAGGAGNDTYLLPTGDTVVELAAGGIDTVQTGGSLALSNSLSEIENLTLTGSASLRGTGNNYANTLAGNAGANLLTGLGLNDLLQGNAGNDTLAGGTGNDTLQGGDGNDLLQGSTGNDTLTGGAGADVFSFDTSPLSTTNRDTLTDFNALEDSIRLDCSFFSALTPGTLGSAQFAEGAGMTVAPALEVRIFCNTTTGDLYYDADGSALVSAALRFATLTNLADIDSANFLLVS